MVKLPLSVVCPGRVWIVEHVLVQTFAQQNALFESRLDAGPEVVVGFVITSESMLADAVYFLCVLWFDLRVQVEVAAVSTGRLAFDRSVDDSSCSLHRVQEAESLDHVCFSRPVLHGHVAESLYGVAWRYLLCPHRCRVLSQHLQVGGRAILAQFLIQVVLHHLSFFRGEVRVVNELFQGPFVRSGHVHPLTQEPLGVVGVGQEATFDAAAPQKELVHEDDVHAVIVEDLIQSGVFVHWFLQG